MHSLLENLYIYLYIFCKSECGKRPMEEFQPSEALFSLQIKPQKNLDYCSKDSELIARAMTSLPLRAASRHSVQPSCECFHKSVVFILPLSLLCSKAYRASWADWRKEVLALARKAWLMPLRWSTASEDFTVTLGCAEGSKMAQPWYNWECVSVLTCGDCKNHFCLHIKVSNLKGTHSGCGSEFAVIGSCSNITAHYLLPFKPLRH